MKTFLFIFLILPSFFSECPPYGSAFQNSDLGKENILKNRKISFFQNDTFLLLDFYQTLQKNSSYLNLPSNLPIGLAGYIFAVEKTGPESCNCNSKDVNIHDIHVVLVPDRLHTDIKYKIIVEVTPYVKFSSDSLNILYSFDNFKRMFLHKEVLIKGLLFYDKFHERNSYNTAKIPFSKSVWRGTCLEIHPVFYVYLL
jgi:hypothetical protein